MHEAEMAKMSYKHGKPDTTTVISYPESAHALSAMAVCRLESDLKHSNQVQKFWAVLT